MSRPLIFLLLVISSLHSASGAAFHAVVVGVNDTPRYRSADGTAPRPLRGAEADAESLAATLIESFGFPKSNVRILLGPQATRDAVRTALTEAAKKLGPDDVCIFHFSGHGTQTPDRKPYDEADELDEALCLYDAATDGSGLLLDDELGLLLEDLPARNVTVLLDCCHAGTGTKDTNDDLVSRRLPLSSPRPVARNDADKQEPWRELRGATKSFGRRSTSFFACRPEQQAYERRLPGMQSPARVGQFSRYLLLGLREKKADADADGTITNREAFDFVTAQLNESFNRGRAEAVDRQEPALESDDEHGPLFGVAPPRKP